MNETDGDALDLPSLVVSEQSRMLLPSRPECIGAAADFLCQKAVLCGGCQEKRATKITMALHEALSNAIVHGNLELSSGLKELGDSSFAEELAHRAADERLAARTVDVHFDFNGERCRWTISDQGNGFDHQRLLAGVHSDDPEMMLSSGRGILIMRSFMDGVAYEDGGRRLLLTLQCAKERRTDERLRLATPVEVAPLRNDGSVDWEAAFKTVATNISENGMALVHEKLVTGERIMISLQSGGKAVTVPAEIRHSRALSGVFMEIGCRFLTSPSETAATAAHKQSAAIHEAITTLLEVQQQQVEEQREHHREAFSEVIEISFSGKQVTGYTRDLSRGGVAFIAATPLPDEVTLIFPPRGEVPTIRMRSQVVRSTKIRDDLYDFGARFVELLGE